MPCITECSRISNFVKDLIQKRGYPLEIHSVTTEDGYINTLYRIPYGKNEKTTCAQQKTPVLVVHGLLASCADWINQEDGLGYFLADSGYDVWLANCRGTTFARGHVSLDFCENAWQYWDFSWHEIGYYDVPAFIDHVLSITNLSKVLYIGHSQGITSLFVLTSSRPEYNEKILLCCALAPAVIFDKARIFPTKLMAHTFTPLQSILRFFHASPRKIPLSSLVRRLIRQGERNCLLRKLSLQYMFLIAGHADMEQTTKMDLSKIGITTVNTASWRQLIHFSQCIRSGKFARYDFGKSRNRDVYNTDVPPIYDIAKVTAPVAIFYGKNDLFFQAEDMGTLADKLGNVIHKYEIDWKLFNHLDFLYAKDSVALAYEHILDIIRMYDK